MQSPRRCIEGNISKEIAELEQAGFIRPEDVNVTSARWVILQHFRQKHLAQKRREVTICS